jgi:hypothetical protein
VDSSGFGCCTVAYSYELTNVTSGSIKCLDYVKSVSLSRILSYFFFKRHFDDISLLIFTQFAVVSCVLVTELQLLSCQVRYILSCWN